MTMVMQRVCDRCGAVENKAESSFWMRVRHNEEEEKLGHRIDLCLKCERAFMDWLEKDK